MQRIDVFLQYYRPHVSGLTNYAAIIAEDAAANGYDVHVHCVAQSGPSTTVVMDGVTVHAYRKSFTIGRGVFSLALLRSVWRMRSAGGVAHVHMPYPESFYLAWVLHRHWRIVATYHCDAPFTGGLDTLIARALDWSHTQLIRRTAVTITSSADYGEHSRLKNVMTRSGIAAVPATTIDRAGGRPTYAVEGRRLLGFMGRPTHEKGIDVLLEALSKLQLDDVSLLFAGPTSGLSERVGYDIGLFNELIESGRIIPVGFLEENEIPDFLASLDAYVFPSVNSFEAFGIVQIEAMSAGVPVVASNLPGVRTAVWDTGLGEVTRAGDSDDLVRGIHAALDSKYDMARARTVLEEKYLAPRPQEAYRRHYATVTTL